MTLHQLQIFLKVAKLGSIKTAAEQLRIAQPAISRQLHLLTAELGVTLHRRVGNKIELTAAGRFFVKETRKIISRLKKLKPMLNRKAPRSTPQTLNVGGTHAESASFLPEMMARFGNRYPRVKLHLRARDRLSIEHMLLKGEVELAVVHRRPTHRQLVTEPYTTEPLAAFVAPNHPLAHKGRLEWGDLGRVGFVTRKGIHEPGMAERYLESLKQHGLEPTVLMHCDSPEAVKVAVVRNNGVGILFRRLVKDNIKRSEFKELKLPKNGRAFATKTMIVYHRNRPLSFCAQDFLKLLRKYRPKD